MAAMLGIFGIGLLFSGVQVTSSVLTVDIPQRVYKIARDDTVTIPCKFTPQTSPTAQVRVTWKAAPDKPEDPVISIVTYNGPTSIKVQSKYRGRATFIHDIPNGKADLQLQKVTSTDTRSYECNVEDVNNEEDAVSDTASLIVLVAPTPPVCKIEGVAEYFQDIKLTCHSAEGTPAPTYKWQSYTTANVPRPNPNKATDLNGVLSLFNVTMETSGFYICTSANEIRSETCNLTLAVMPPSMSMASIGGIVGAAVGVVVLFGAIILCCYCCRRKEKPEEYAMGTPEGEEFTDKEPEGKDYQRVTYEEERSVKSAADRRDPPDDRSERSYDRRSDYTDRRDDPKERRERDDRYDDRYDDRRDDRYSDRYDDRRSDRYDDRYDDRRDDRRGRVDDRRGRVDDRRGRDDDNYESDRYSERSERPPMLPPNKPRDPRI
ncbi:glycoprotein A33 (transmembrane), paralog a [Pseudorasbora parva]|uniref:glycoprotein A33 (transmembrane), paralog a n=1 Tax=Pseudorasbora parva TaxID=51549 RepID=UPI00351DB45D